MACSDYNFNESNDLNTEGNEQEIVAEPEAPPIPETTCEAWQPPSDYAVSLNESCLPTRTNNWHLRSSHWVAMVRQYFATGTSYTRT